MSDQKPTKHTGPPENQEQSPRITMTEDKNRKVTEKKFSKKQADIKEFDRAVLLVDLAEGEQAFASVSALSESPTTPSTDEVRLYFRTGGRLFKFTGSEV